MYTPGELRALAAVVAEAARTVAPELVIVVDEIYEKIVYGGIEHLSIGSLPEVADRTVTINGLSKAFAMTGWRVGYAACPGEFGLALIRAIDNLQGQMTSCIPAFILPAIRAALTECAAETEAMREAFARRARLIYDLAKGIPGLRCPRPTGAFYIFPDVSAFFGKTTPGGTRITDSLSFGDALLTEAHVAVVPGVEFGACAANHIRISFACSEETIEAGMGAISRCVTSLR
jgi:aspartate aminotransferase